ncbi:MAG: GrpB family protein [Candidatus Taylorbacteria bacterium]|nr:GrpB family protein [Candidatus Taylorbacteria bacterium]
MITREQEEWLSHLSDTGSVKIVPFDPKSDQKFENIKRQIQSLLGNETEVLHRGASALGISGQPEIDIYIPVSAKRFDHVVSEMQIKFGKPYSVYPLERTKFILSVDGTKLEIMVVNESCKSWTNNEIFYEYMKKHPDALEQYRKLKEDAAGHSNRAYYRRKIEFINDIMSRAK